MIVVARRDGRGFIEVDGQPHGDFTGLPRGTRLRWSSERAFDLIVMRDQEFLRLTGRFGE